MIADVNQKGNCQAADPCNHHPQRILSLDNIRSSTAGQWRKRIDKEALRAEAAGHWPRLIEQICGVDTSRWRRPGPCPKCNPSGTDRFSAFPDFDQAGGVICRKCHADHNSDGFSTIGWLLPDRSFGEVLRLVDDALHGNSSRPRPTRRSAPSQAESPAAPPVRSPVVGSAEGDERLRKNHELYARFGRDRVPAELLRKDARRAGPGTIRKFARKLNITAESLRYAGARIGVHQCVDADGNPIDLTMLLIPERGLDGKICGYQRRTAELVARKRDGSDAANKRQLYGGRRGCSIANANPSSRLYLGVEGASCLFAAYSAGINAISRPSNRGGADHHIEFLQSNPDRQLVVCGEYDQKPDRSWPGYDGMRSVAEKVVAATVRTVWTVMPPAAYKDFREWYVARVDNPHNPSPESTAAFRAEVSEHIRQHAERVDPAPEAIAELNRELEEQARLERRAEVAALQKLDTTEHGDNSTHVGPQSCLRTIGLDKPDNRGRRGVFLMQVSCGSPDCPICGPEIWSPRHSLHLAKCIREAPAAYQTEIPRSRWSAVQQKIAREKRKDPKQIVEYARVNVDGGMVRVVSTVAVPCGAAWEEIDRRDAADTARGMAVSADKTKGHPIRYSSGWRSGRHPTAADWDVAINSRLTDAEGQWHHNVANVAIDLTEAEAKNAVAEARSWDRDEHFPIASWAVSCQLGNGKWIVAGNLPAVPNDDPRNQKMTGPEAAKVLSRAVWEASDRFSEDGSLPVKSATWSVKASGGGRRIDVRRPLSVAVEMLRDAADSIEVWDPQAEDPLSPIYSCVIGSFAGTDANERADRLIAALGAAEAQLPQNLAFSGAGAEREDISRRESQHYGKYLQRPPDPGGQLSLFADAEAIAT